MNPVESFSEFGVFFLANDRVWELAMAFLASFRAFNPNTPLTLVPYDEDVKRLKTVAGVFNFGVFSNEAVLQKCDSISSAVLGRKSGTFRKLACWRGSYLRFIYIDVDTVVQSELTATSHAAAPFDFLASHSNMPHIRRWVWKRPPPDDRIRTYNTEFCASTGFFCGVRKQWFDHLVADSLIQTARDLRPYLADEGEQAYLNLAVTSCGMVFSSLSELKRSTGSLNVKLEQWAGTRGGHVHAGKIWFPNRPAVLILHWAGVWQATALERILYKLLGVRPDRRCMRLRIPYQRLWQYYRNLAAEGLKSSGNAELDA